MHTSSSSVRSLVLVATVFLFAWPALLAADDASGKKPAPAAEKGKPRKPEAGRNRPAEAKPKELQQQLEATRRELDQARDSLHEAQKELGAKAETISSLEAKLSSVSKQLEKAQADLKKSAPAAAELDRAKRALEAEKKKVTELRDEVKAAQKKTAEARTPLKKETPTAAKAISIAPILYDKNTAVNYPERDRALGQVREALKRSPKAKVSLTGYADDSRYAQTNREVSENRAKFLAAYFVSQGIAADRIEYRGLGNTRPVKGQPNRRVEIEIRP